MADSSAGRTQLTWGVQAGALWSPVAAASPDAAALLDLNVQALLQGHLEFIWMGCRQVKQGHTGHVCVVSKSAT